MIELDGSIARFYFRCANLPAGVFGVTRFTYKEALSKPWHCEVELLSDDAYIAFDDVVNHRAAFTMKRGREDVVIHGIVIDFEQLGRHTEEYMLYRAVLAPSLWRLSLNFQSRIFQHKTVEEILTEVLEGAALVAQTDFEFRLSETYEPREYCVQYGETDLAFVQRLTEFEGIWYFFEHGDDREKLIFTDDHGQLGPIDGEQSVVYHDQAGIETEPEEVVRELRCRQQMVLKEVKLKNYNYEEPEMNLLIESPPDDASKRGDFGLYYQYGEHYKTPRDGERLARVRHEELSCRRRVLEGRSTCVGFRAGYIMEVEGHFRSDYDRDYVLEEVEHRGSQWQALPIRGEGEGLTYENRFKCLPADALYRPERTTPKPDARGVMLGRIDQADTYADIDEEGRYRAVMDFDLSGPGSMEGTLPIPKSQIYSGEDYGVHFPSHKDKDLLWVCFNGDVDQPYSVGELPTPSQASPSKRPNRWQSVIRTWGQNELTFDDKQGEENIFMHATKDHTVDVVNDETITVGHDQSTSVGHDQTIRVEHDRTKSVGHDETNVITNDRTTTIEEGHDTLTVSEGTQTVSIKGDTSLTVQAGSRTVSVTGGDYKGSVDGGNFEAAASAAVKLHGQGAGADITGDASGVKITGTGEGVNIKGNGGAGVFIQGDPDIILNAAGAVALSATEIILFASSSIVISCMGSMIQMTPSSINLEASTITSNGGEVSVQAGVIKHNG